jgi:uncharacterized protein (DUF2249 family)
VNSVIDALAMVPPEPMERVLEALSLLERGDTVTLLLPREPFPLYRVLEARGFAWATSLAPDGVFTIVIRQAP